MRSRWIALTFAVAATSAASPLYACMGGAPLALDDVRFADTVVVGRIVNYRIVLDQKFRRKMGIRRPRAGTPVRSEYMSDYARFEIVVDEVLLGRAGARIAATWDNSTFPEPETMAPGPYLIALRRSGSSLPPLRGPSATIAPSPEPATLTVLQAPCSVPFMFETGSEDAAGVRNILAKRPRSD